MLIVIGQIGQVRSCTAPLSLVVAGWLFLDAVGKASLSVARFLDSICVYVLIIPISTPSLRPELHYMLVGEME